MTVTTNVKDSIELLTFGVPLNMLSAESVYGLAGSKTTPVPILTKLAEELAEGNLQLHTGEPNLHPFTKQWRRAVFEAPLDAIKNVLIKNQNLPPEFYEKLADGKDEETLLALAASPHSTPEKLDELWDMFAATAKKTIDESDKDNRALYRQEIQSTSAGLSNILQNPNTSNSTLLKALELDSKKHGYLTNFSVMILCHPNLSDEALIQNAHKNIEYALQNPKITRDIISEILIQLNADDFKLWDATGYLHELVLHKKSNRAIRSRALATLIKADALPQLGEFSHYDVRKNAWKSQNGLGKILASKSMDTTTLEEAAGYVIAMEQRHAPSRGATLLFRAVFNRNCPLSIVLTLVNNQDKYNLRNNNSYYYDQAIRTPAYVKYKEDQKKIKELA